MATYRGIKPATQSYWGSQQAGKVISLAAYQEDKKVAEGHQPTVLDWFERLDRYEPVIWAIIMLSYAYVVAQCLRWWLM